MNKFYLFIIAGLALVLLMREGCNCLTISKLKKDCAAQQKAVIIKRDTIQGAIVVHDTTTKYIPKITSVTEYVPRVTTVVKTDTLHEHPLIVFGDTGCRNKNYYFDSVNVKYGVVYIKDTITQNKISSRQVYTNFYIPQINTTTQLKERNKVFLGILAQGNKATILSGAGVGATLETKGGRLYDAAAIYTQQNNFIYQVGLKFKL